MYFYLFLACSMVRNKTKNTTKDNKEELSEITFLDDNMDKSSDSNSSNLRVGGRVKVIDKYIFLYSFHD